MRLSDKTKQTRHLISQLAKGAHTHLVTTHRDPDMDAIGSMMGWSACLKDLGHHVHPWMADPVPEWLHLQVDVGDIVSAIPQSQYDVIWVLDCADDKRVSNLDALRACQGVMVNVDHHVDNTGFGDYAVIEPVSSVGELLACMAHEANLPVSVQAATWWMAAIVADTGRFLFPNTTASTFDTVRWLVECGGNMNLVTQFLEESLTSTGLEAIRQALNSVRLDPTGQVALTILPDGMEEGVAVIRILRQVKSIEVVAVLRSLPSGDIRVNLRSKQRVAVNAVAHQFGGGGHERAAGLTLRMPLHEAADTILTALTDALS